MKDQKAAEVIALKNGGELPVYRVARFGGGWYWQCKSPYGVYSFSLPEKD
jgi:hypothetical protein